APESEQVLRLTTFSKDIRNGERAVSPGTVLECVA
ncbi:MAG: hypothetical protein ACI9UN_004895, partial [Granulosicoccus sp.]